MKPLSGRMNWEEAYSVGVEKRRGRVYGKCLLFTGLGSRWLLTGECLLCVPSGADNAAAIYLRFAVGRNTLPHSQLHDHNTTAFTTDQCNNFETDLKLFLHLGD